MKCDPARVCCPTIVAPIVLGASGMPFPVSGLQQSLTICRDPHAQEGFAMKVLALATQKGGTGKSSLAVSLAVAAQERSLKVYVVDLDPQATARKWFERREAEGPLTRAG